MSKNDFLLMLNEYFQQENLVDKYKDVINTDSSLFDFGWRMMDLAIKTNFNEDQIDLINWWLYDRTSPWYTTSEYDGLGITSASRLYDYLQTLN